MKLDPVLTDLRAKLNYAFKQTSEQRSSEFFLLCMMCCVNSFAAKLALTAGRDLK